MIDRLFFNSVQKSQWAHMSVSPPWVELWGSKDCHLLKYYNVQKQGSRFNLGLDAAVNTHYIQKCFRWRKSSSWGLLIFSNVFQELSVSPSAFNSFKIINLCKNGIHIHENLARRTIFGFKIWQNFTSPSNFMMSQKLEQLFPNISIHRIQILKQNS